VSLRLIDGYKVKTPPLERSREEGFPYEKNYCLFFDKLRFGAFR
jgi:hypothetical protein